ncbi:Minor histocompatibility antigen H13, partial [Tetrabaena socialis]
AVATAEPVSAAVPAPDPGSAAAASSGDNSWRWEESEDAVRAYGALAALLALGSLPVLHGTKLADLPYFIGLAVVTIYIGAHRGLTTRQRQQISLKEGALAPVLASVSLFGIYLAIKYLPDLNVQAFLNAYFWLLGSFAIGGAALPVLRRIGGPLGERTIKLELPEGLLLDEDGSSITKPEIAPTDVLAVALALGLASAELSSGHTNFTLNNLIATLIASDILQLIGPRSFRTAGLLLTGLLLYDVFWVFGSPRVIGDNVMMTVATSELISGPTRLLFPRIPGGGSTAEAAAAAFPFSLLGLGDIAVPGLLACLALRYDASRSTDLKARAVAAAEAMTSALASLAPGATSRQHAAAATAEPRVSAAAGHAACAAVEPAASAAVQHAAAAAAQHWPSATAQHAAAATAEPRIAEATADAAEAAYDRVADREARQRSESLDGTHDRDRDRDRATAAAASSLGSSLLRGVSGGSSSLGSSRASVSASTAATASASATAAAAAAVAASPASAAAPAEPEQPRLAASEAVLHQRTYFTPVMLAYVAGLMAAFVANDVTGLGQPALLYIVPATLGAVLLTGLRRGEVGRLWDFTDVPSFGVPAAGSKGGREGGGEGAADDGKAGK